MRRAIQAEMESVKEVMVHVSGHAHPNVVNDERLMRPQKEIEDDVKRVLSSFPDIKGKFLSVCFCYFPLIRKQECRISWRITKTKRLPYISTYSWMTTFVWQT